MSEKIILVRQTINIDGDKCGKCVSLCRDSYKKRLCVLWSVRMERQGDQSIRCSQCLNAEHEADKQTALITELVGALEKAKITVCDVCEFCTPDNEFCSGCRAHESINKTLAHAKEMMG